MKIAAIDSGLVVSTPCKVNPFLDIVARRTDGYHELDTVMIALDICDDLLFRPADHGKIELNILPDSGRISPGIPYNERITVGTDDNLVVRAMHMLATELGVHARMSVTLTKRIPVQAGLGGGSSDAAACLVAGQLVWTGRFDRQLAIDLAKRLGSDVNFFLEAHNGDSWAANCTGRGELIQPVSVVDSFDWLVIIPEEGCDTSKVFGHFVRENALPSAHRSSGTMVDALARGDIDLVRSALFNRLFASAATVSTSLSVLAGKLDRLLGLPYVMSGSGSTMILPVETHRSDVLARRLQASLGCPVFTAKLWRSEPLNEQMRLTGVQYTPAE